MSARHNVRGADGVLAPLGRIGPFTACGLHYSCAHVIHDVGGLHNSCDGVVFPASWAADPDQLGWMDHHGLFV